MLHEYHERTLSPFVWGTRVPTSVGTSRGMGLLVCTWIKLARPTADPHSRSTGLVDLRPILTRRSIEPS